MPLAGDRVGFADPGEAAPRYTFEGVIAARGLGRIRRAFDHLVAVEEVHDFRPGDGHGRGDFNTSVFAE